MSVGAVERGDLGDSSGLVEEGIVATVVIGA